MSLSLKWVQGVSLISVESTLEASFVLKLYNPHPDLPHATDVSYKRD